MTTPPSLSYRARKTQRQRGGNYMHTYFTLQTNMSEARLHVSVAVPLLRAGLAALESICCLIEEE